MHKIIYLANMSQCVVFEIVTYCYICLGSKCCCHTALAMQSCYWVASEEVANVEYIFELTRNETFNYNYYAISTLISLTSYDSK